MRVFWAYVNGERLYADEVVGVKEETELNKMLEGQGRKMKHFIIRERELFSMCRYHV